MDLYSADQAKRFHRAGRHRLEDAQILLSGMRTTGAIYLGGYAVECVLKSLILLAVPVGEREETFDRFRGAHAHNLESLKAQYQSASGTTFPRLVSKSFVRVYSWSTDLRYETKAVQFREAELFLTAAVDIIRWAEERL